MGSLDVRWHFGVFGIGKGNSLEVHYLSQGRWAIDTSARARLPFTPRGPMIDNGKVHETHCLTVRLWVKTTKKPSVRGWAVWCERD